MGAIIHTGKQRIKHIGIEIDGIGHQPPDRQEQITSAKLLMTPTAWLRYGSGGGARGEGGRHRGWDGIDVAAYCHCQRYSGRGGQRGETAGSG